MANLIKIPYDNREEWLRLRQQGIGGSEAGIVLGLSNYCSPYRLWLEKTGKLEAEDISDKEVVRLGNDLEAYVAERWCEATGKKVRRCNFILRNPEMPFAHANPDRMVVGENAGLECKTTSSYDIVAECKKGFPTRYYAQCVHYMMVTGADRWYLAVCCFGRGFYHYVLERDEAEIAALAEAEQEFWQMVETETPPELDGSESTSEAVKAMWPESNGSSIDLTPVALAVKYRNDLNKQIKDLQKMLDEQDNIIKDYMGEAESGTVGNTKISWKSGTRSTVDTKKYEADYPGCFENYKKTTTTRTYKVTVKEDK